ncbi:MAG: DUF4070 domain-containing protein [Nostoc sp. LLA-1]|nr:DUF4070 domain-containing protein [Cyanocohniella sp. LLY]
MRLTRFRFWWQLGAIALTKPRLLYDYLTTLGVGEHFFNYRYEVRAQLQEKLAALKQELPQEKVAYQLESVS